MRTLYLAATVATAAEPFATAMVVQDGVVAWLGSSEAAEAHRAQVDQVTDLGGALVTAAFVDAHVHVTETGLALTGPDLTAARSVTDLLDAVAALARQAPGEPIVGHGWDERSLQEQRAPTRAELDRAGGGAPVHLSRVDGHSSVVSSSALALAALPTAGGSTALPGWSQDGPLDREANAAVRLAVRAGLTPARRRDLQTAALKAAAAAGIAAVHEAGTPTIGSKADLAELVELTTSHPQASSLPRVVAYWGELVADETHAKALIAELPAEVRGLAGDLSADGSIGSRTACLQADYADAPGTRGHAYLTVEQVRDHVAACTLVGVQAGFHAIGDAAVDTVLRGMRRAAERVGLAAVRSARHRIEHLECLDADAVREVADLGVTASVQPAFDALWGGPDGMYAERLGPDRAGRMNPFAVLAAAGVPLALGSDSPVTPFDPWGAVRACVLHHEPGQRIGVEAAFAAHTRGGWRAIGDDRCGVLAVGAPATFAAWTSSTPGMPDLTPGRDLPACLLTVRDGVVLHDAR